MTRADEALEKALRLIDEDGLGIEGCLAQFSASEAEKLRPLLQTIVAVKEGALAAPAPVRREENKAVFLAELAELRASEGAAERSVGRRAAPFRNWLRTRVGHTVAAATAAAVLTGGVAGAAGNSGPASPLYPVKRAVEVVETALPRSDYAQAKLRLELAETRLAELERAEGRKDAANERLYEDFSDELLEVKNLAPRLSDVEERRASSRYEELELRYKNVSHRRLEEPRESPEEKSDRPVKGPPRNESAPQSTDGDEEKAGDTERGGGENGGSQEEPQTDQNVGSDGGGRKAHEEAVRQQSSELSKDDRKKAEARRRRHKRAERRKAEARAERRQAEERKRAVELRGFGNRSDEFGTGSDEVGD